MLSTQLKTDWILFQNLVEDFIDTNVILKTEDVIIAAVEHFNTSVQNEAWTSTLQIRKNNSSMHSFPTNITDLISAKRKARKKWQQNRFSLDKKHLNCFFIKLKKLQRSTTENYKANSKDLIQPTRLIIVFGNSQKMS